MKDDKNYIQYQILEKYIEMLKSEEKEVQSEDDKTFRENVTNEITNRDTEYTKLLSHFVFVTKIRNFLKEFFKWTFYVVVISSIFLFMLLTYKLFDKFITNGTIEELVEAIPLFMTSIIGLVSVIIAIPIAITKYLFSTKEDENITRIILHTQEHDTTGRQWTLDFKKVLKKIDEDIKEKQNEDLGNSKEKGAI